MTLFEIIIVLISSGILTSLLTLFYRFGRNQERQDNHFKISDEKMEQRFKINDEKMEQRFKINDEKMEQRFKSIDEKLQKMEFKIDELKHSVIDIDKRLYAVETVLHMKDCCVLKQDQNLKRAE